MITDDVNTGQKLANNAWRRISARAESQPITLWQVDDFATRDSVINYYQHLRKNMDRSAALRQVQLEMLRNPEYKRPYYWAAFIPSSKWTSLDVKP